MRMVVRTTRWIAALLFAGLVGTIPACGTMGGGGGMKYLVDPPAAASDA